MSAAFPNQRILPIDIFRGLTILVMIFVNQLSSVKGIPQWAKHMPADADAMTFVDIVFPAFLFIVGMSIPFAIQIRSSRGGSIKDILSHSLIRGVSLIIIGFYTVNVLWGWDNEKMPFSIYLWALLMYACVMLVWAHYPKHLSSTLTNGLKTAGGVGLIILWYLYEGVEGQGMTTQWWGILGLIGWAYVMTLPIYLISKKVLILGIAVLAYYAAYLLLDNLSANDNPVLHWFIENRRNTTHAALVLMGTILSILIYHKDHAQKYAINTAIYFCVTIIAAFVSWQVSPISKIWATPTWALFSVAVCIACFFVVHLIIEKMKITYWTKFIEPVANNALLVYILPDILIALFALLAISTRPEMFDAGLLGVIWTVIFTIAIMCLGGLLNKIGFKLKL